MILIFGSSGFVGKHVSNHFKTMNKSVTPVTRHTYDMSTPDSLDGLDCYDDIETIVWCSGFNHNDRVGSLDYTLYDTTMDVNVNAIVKSMDYLLSNNKVKDGARLCV